LEVAVYNKTSVVDKPVFVDRPEDVFINVSVAACDQHAALKLHLILLPLYFLMLVFVSLVVVISCIHVSIALVIRVVGVVVRHLHFVLLFLFIGNVQALEHHSFKLCICVILSVSAGDDLKQLGVSNDCNTQFKQHFLNFGFDVVVVFKSIRVDEWDVFVHLLIMVFIGMTLDSWDAQVDVLGFHTTVDQTLNCNVAV
jgi:hypothetical protein